MKFLDIINEDTSFTDKEEKRVKTIFKAFRKGIVKVQHPRTNEIIKFRYHINDNVFYRWENGLYGKELTVITNNFPGEGITIYCDDEDVVNKCTNDIKSISKNPTGIHLREMFVNKLKNKFNKFDAKIYVNEKGMKFVLDEPSEPINEGRVGNMGGGITDKELKKVKALYTALKRGFFKYSYHSTYGYELPEDYYSYRDELGDVCIKMTGQNGQEPKFFSKLKIGSEYMTTKIDPKFDAIIKWVEGKVKDKFEEFNIKFIF